MNYRTRLFPAILCAAMLIATAAAAIAQPVFTSTRCPTVTVTNNHAACPATVSFNTTPVGVWPVVTIPPGGSIILPVPAAGVIVNGITTVGGNAVTFNPPAPPAFVACGPDDWWIANVSLTPPAVPPAPFCCFDVCADPCLCTITLWPTTAIQCIP